MNQLIFKEYFDKRIENSSSNNAIKKPGPTITISRSAGCFATKLAFDIAKELNNRLKSEKWDVINKEMLRYTAEQINLSSETIENTLNYEDKTFFEEIIFTFLSSDYQLEFKVRKTLINVIQKLCVEGYHIMIGRGSNIIAANIQNALHIKLDAPFNDRVNNIKNLKNITEEEAIEYVKTTDHKREKLCESIKGEAVLGEDYDLMINSSKFSKPEIVDIILKTLEIKNMI